MLHVRVRWMYSARGKVYREVPASSFEVRAERVLKMRERKAASMQLGASQELEFESCALLT